MTDGFSRRRRVDVLDDYDTTREQRDEEALQLQAAERAARQARKECRVAKHRKAAMRSARQAREILRGVEDARLAAEAKLDAYVLENYTSWSRSWTSCDTEQRAHTQAAQPYEQEPPAFGSFGSIVDDIEALAFDDELVVPTHLVQRPREIPDDDWRSRYVWVNDD